MSQSWVPISTIMKTAPKILESPKYAKNVAMIQVDKFLRNLFPLYRGRRGQPYSTVQHSYHRRVQPSVPHLRPMGRQRLLAFLFAQGAEGP